MTDSNIPRADVRDNIVQQWSPGHANIYPRSGTGSPIAQDISNGQHHQPRAPETPPFTEEDERLWRDQELNRKIMQNVEEHGITKPRGHKVSFHYNSRVEDMHFGKTHPMKPWRLTLTKHLVLGYGLHYAMDTYEAVAAGKDQVRAFHDPDYVDFLAQVSPQTFAGLCEKPRFAQHIPPKHEHDTVDLGPFNLSTSPGADCPVFDGMSTYLFLYTGATLAATHQLTTNQSDIAINWSGGLHHAHRAEASGFCYINDIVLSILDMLRIYPRVLYIDIDVHHGDGVEEAFQRQPRVMTLSYHRFGPYDDTGHRFFPGADCPVFDGMSTYLFLYTGATLAATHQLTTNQSDIAINWSGGLHHAHRAEASGFCYINDIVLSILDMLRIYPRVLYIDIDVHHGDGVEEAFQRQPRVMTLSYHRFGPYDDTGHRFFPGTGDLTDVGLRGTVGEHFALNVPIPSGIDDRQYKYLFESVTGRAIEAFKPSAIVLQCGADSLGGDRLGQFNLNIKQHGECVSFVKRTGLPLLILGGGGYTARNVARAWCHETALATDNTLPETLPMDIIPRPEAFSGPSVHGNGKLFPNFKVLHINECKDPDLEYMVKQLDWELRYVRNSPWVKMDQLPVQRVQQEVMDEVEEEMKSGKAERDRRWRERNPAGRGELR